MGIFEQHGDIGACELEGDMEYCVDCQVYELVGSGENMWFDKDQFHFVWKKLSGDFIIRARVKFIGDGVNAHRKMGLMIRSSLGTDVPHVNGVVHGDGLTSIQFRREKGGITEERKSPASLPDILQLERRGSQYILSTAHYGEPFDTIMLKDMDLEDEVYVGLFICSHDNTVLEKAKFSNVRIIIPAWEGLVPYQDYLGSKLEILELERGLRKVVHQSPLSLQAPNWSTNGKYLIYNSEGLLYRFDLKSGIPEVIPSGFATSNNNDHVISFDGKKLGISHHAEEADGQSIVYTMPIKGGTPEKITDEGPSYLHGWSPDGEYLTYTARRNGQYDIYKISVNEKEEIKLTDTPGLDDGSEYSPDGKYIYFNSDRTGNMKIWRMYPDGSNQEQITFGEFNDWFPHISPDGKWMVFLSFQNDVRSDDHPFYKHVYLRKMPVAGGEPEVIAYVYGGQGTINVPSWSPDSKKIAFVSNSKITDLFAKENLVAWCIVPFDAEGRSPEERADMLDELGISQLAYDYRDEHLPFFEEEIGVLEAHGIELSSVWFWVQGGSDGLLNNANEFILESLKKTGTQTELWVSFPENYFEGNSDSESLQKAVSAIREVLHRAEEIGCTLALYNHGGWFGEPENLIRIIDAIGSDKIKIVYNFHHGHHRIDHFEKDFTRMMPYLSTININGMRKEGPKIITLGEGDQELDMLKVIKESGYKGPIGILGHTEGEDIQIVLKRNLEGLEQLEELLR